MVGACFLGGDTGTGGNSSQGVSAAQAALLEMKDKIREEEKRGA